MVIVKKYYKGEKAKDIRKKNLDKGESYLFDEYVILNQR